MFRGDFEEHQIVACLMSSTEVLTRFGVVDAREKAVENGTEWAFRSGAIEAAGRAFRSCSGQIQSGA